MPFRAPGSDVLGPRPPFQPQQAITAAANNSNVFNPSALHAALQASSATQQSPGTSEWFFDTGATSHMSSSLGNVLPSSLHPSSSVITVGNGARMPATHRALSIIPTATSPLHLTDVLISPSLIKNLISVRRLTRDNAVSIKFDPSGFSIKDLRTRAEMLRSPSAFWAEALATVTCLINRRPCRATGMATPYALLLGTPPDYNELRVIGCRCFPNTIATAPHKLAA
ncbi:uncharacterized protein LOC110437641 [Sorghum bicolor]|uniref:uncharacterized protein LOC110437641 n=1 Tax=Sorghum bicolor TaxID=4558 RepID=UPI000B4267CD|nr:uncharacterized protein LOC110437641 [Sorghum bicolor]|eukprot:XP_021321821.1 uncharacterized protein LOC110437641 [Sorghum bicolor]